MLIFSLIFETVRTGGLATGCGAYSGVAAFWLLFAGAFLLFSLAFTSKAYRDKGGDLTFLATLEVAVAGAVVAVVASVWALGTLVDFTGVGFLESFRLTAFPNIDLASRLAGGFLSGLTGDLIFSAS